MKDSNFSVYMKIILFFYFIQTFELDKQASKLELESKMDYPLNIIPSIDKNIWHPTEFAQIELFKKYIIPNTIISVVRSFSREVFGIISCLYS